MEYIIPLRRKYKDELYLLRVILDVYDIKGFFFVHVVDFISVLCDCIKVYQKDTLFFKFF
jgi:hypothetical protein